MSRYGMIALATMALLSPALAQKGNTSRGQRDFQACAPCHSLEPDRNMTGPSLAGLWGRKPAAYRASTVTPILSNLPELSGMTARSTDG
jgi:cytochrome c2